MSRFGLDVQWSPNTEIFFMGLTGMIITAFEDPFLTLADDVNSTWTTEIPDELVSPPWQGIVKIVMVGLILARSCTVHLYIASYIILLWPLFLEHHATLMLPWLVVAAVRNIISEVTAFFMGSAICVHHSQLNGTCVEFMLAKGMWLMPGMYMWLSTLYLYHDLRSTAPGVLPLSLRAPLMSARRRRCTLLADERVLRRRLWDEVTSKETHTKKQPWVEGTRCMRSVSMDNDLNAELPDADAAATLHQHRSLDSLRDRLTWDWDAISHVVQARQEEDAKLSLDQKAKAFLALSQHEVTDAVSEARVRRLLRSVDVACQTAPIDVDLYDEPKRDDSHYGFTDTPIPLFESYSALSLDDRPVRITESLSYIVMPPRYGHRHQSTQVNHLTKEYVKELALLPDVSTITRRSSDPEAQHYLVVQFDDNGEEGRPLSAAHSVIHLQLDHSGNDGEGAPLGTARSVMFQLDDSGEDIPEEFTGSLLDMAMYVHSRTLTPAASKMSLAPATSNMSLNTSVMRLWPRGDDDGASGSGAERPAPSELELRPKTLIETILEESVQHVTDMEELYRDETEDSTEDFPSFVGTDAVGRSDKKARLFADPTLLFKKYEESEESLKMPAHYSVSVQASLDSSQTLMMITSRTPAPQSASSVACDPMTRSVGVQASLNPAQALFALRPRRTHFIVHFMAVSDDPDDTDDPDAKDKKLRAVRKALETWHHRKNSRVIEKSEPDPRKKSVLQRTAKFCNEMYKTALEDIPAPVVEEVVMQKTGAWNSDDNLKASSSEWSPVASGTAIVLAAPLTVEVRRELNLDPIATHASPHVTTPDIRRLHALGLVDAYGGRQVLKNIDKRIAEERAKRIVKTRVIAAEKERDRMIKIEELERLFKDTIREMEEEWIKTFAEDEDNLEREVGMTRSVSFKQWVRVTETEESEGDEERELATESYIQLRDTPGSTYVGQEGIAGSSKDPDYMFIPWADAKKQKGRRMSTKRINEEYFRETDAERRKRMKEEGKEEEVQEVKDEEAAGAKGTKKAKSIIKKKVSKKVETKDEVKDEAMDEVKEDTKEDTKEEDVVDQEDSAAETQKVKKKRFKKAEKVGFAKDEPEKGGKHIKKKEETDDEPQDQEEVKEEVKDEMKDDVKDELAAGPAERKKGKSILKKKAGKKLKPKEEPKDDTNEVKEEEEVVNTDEAVKKKEVHKRRGSKKHKDKHPEKDDEES